MVANFCFFFHFILLGGVGGWMNAHSDDDGNDDGNDDEDDNSELPVLKNIL